MYSGIGPHTDDGTNDEFSGPADEVEMQWLLLIGAVLLSLGAALGTAALVLSLVFRIMSKLR